jgi:putative endonuclease
VTTRENVTLSVAKGTDVRRVAHQFGSVRVYYVYILSSPSRVLYIGVTNDITRRLAQHRSGDTPGYTSRRGAFRLVHLESTTDVTAAIRREKQLKGWKRSKKLALIEEGNPQWLNLSP